MRERDHCGANFHYDIVVQTDATNSTSIVAAGAPVNHTQQLWKSIGIVVDASSTWVDVALSGLSWLTEGKPVQLSVRAVNDEGPATGLLQSVTVSNNPSTSGKQKKTNSN